MQKIYYIYVQRGKNKNGFGKLALFLLLKKIELPNYQLLTNWLIRVVEL